MGTDPARISAEHMIHAQALVRYVLPVRSRKAKAAPKLRSAESQKCRIKCSLVRHGRRYTFSTCRLISSTCLPSLCGIAICTIFYRITHTVSQRSAPEIQLKHHRPMWCVNSNLTTLLCSTIMACLDITITELCLLDFCHPIYQFKTKRLGEVDQIELPLHMAIF